MSDSAPPSGTATGAEVDAGDVTLADARPSSGTPPAIGPGATISRYLVIEELGRGGMGVVLRAYDPKLQREVALKLVRAEALSHEARARMTIEARTMARLSHPNVVAVYDVEIDDDPTTSAGVVLVMEYVAGVTLRRWCQEQDPSWRSTLDVFVRAGRGLIEAHGQSVLHRDFKPDNVLVVEGSRGVERVQVTDFGLATAVTSGSSEGEPMSGPVHEPDDALTEEGTVVGTPRYMPPEQHQGAALTPAADQYAFCVALWEALHDAPPFPAQRRLAHKLDGPPPWPTGSPVPRRVGDAIRRGLDPRPDRRWPDLAALLTELAAPPPRHHRFVPALSVAALAGMGISIWWAWTHEQSRRCTGASERLAQVWNEQRSASVRDALLATEVAWAEPVARGVTQRIDTYASSWVQMRTEACEATALRGEQSPEVMDLRMTCLDRARAGMQATIDVLEHADRNVVAKAFDVLHAMPPLSRCADIEALRADVAPPGDAEAESVARARRALSRAKARRKAGKLTQTQESLDEAAGLIEAVSYEPIRSELLLERGLTADARGEYEVAASTLSEAIGASMKWGQWELATRAAIAQIRVIGARRARHADALAHVPMARGLIARSGITALSAALRREVAVVLAQQGKLQEAVLEFQAVLEQLHSAQEPDALALATARSNLGLALARIGRNDEAQAQLDAALQAYGPSVGNEHPHVAGVRQNLAIALANQGELDEARAQMQRAIEIFEAGLGPDHPATIGARIGLAALLGRHGRFEDAEAQYRAVLPVQRARLGETHPEVAMIHSNLSGVMQRTGRTDEAATELETALAILTKSYEEPNLKMGIIRSNLATLRQAQGRSKQAREEFERSLQELRTSVGARSPEVATTASAYAAFEREQGNDRAALELFELAWSIRNRASIDPSLKAGTAFDLAKALARSGDRERAEQLGHRALEELDASPTKPEEPEGLRNDIERWLADQK